MKLKREVLQRVNVPIFRNKIAMVHGIGEQSVALWCRKNRPNGPLTKAASLKVIREELGLTDDQILEELPIGEQAEN